MADIGMATVLAKGATTIGKLTSIGSPEVTLKTQEVTTLDSANAFAEYVGTYLDGGSVEIAGLYNKDDSGQTALVTAQNAKTLDAYTITFPSGTVWSFNALVTSHKLGAATKDDAITFTASLKISGKPTLTTAASNNLSNLVVSDTTSFVPSFAAATYEYVANVANGTDGVTITPTAAGGVIKVNGNTVASGIASSEIALGAAGTITTATVTVTETGKSTKTYTVHIARAA